MVLAVLPFHNTCYNTLHYPLIFHMLIHLQVRSNSLQVKSKNWGTLPMLNLDQPLHHIITQPNLSYNTNLHSNLQFLSNSFNLSFSLTSKVFIITYFSSIFTNLFPFNLTMESNLRPLHPELKNYNYVFHCCVAIGYILPSGALVLGKILDYVASTKT